MGRAIRWQAIIALLGILLLAAVLASNAYDLTSVTAPASGGVYREAIVGIPRAINPLLAFSNDPDRELTGLIYQGLVTLDERSEVQPALATHWEISADQLAYTFHLRRDVRWHDGAPFTAADVLYTVNVLQSDAFAADDFPAPSYLSDLWRTVTATQLDDYTIQFQLQQPYAPFLYETSIGLLPAHLWRDVPIVDMPRSLLNLQPVGTGPWRLTELSASAARLEPNPYVAGVQPYLEALEFHFYPDYAAAFAAVQNDEVDGVSRILSHDLALAQANEDLNVYSAPLAGESLIYFNLTNPNVAFLADKQVRQALSLALDRAAVIDQALDGQGFPADGPIMPGTWAYASQGEPEVDARKAAELLDQAGWQDQDGDGVREKGGQTLAFTLVGDNDALLDALARQWAKVGVQVKPQAVSLVSLAGDHLSPRQYDAALVHWQLSGDPDPYPLWHSTQIEQGQNYSGWSNLDADLIMEQARSVADPGRRMQLYAEFQKIFAEELPALPLYFDVYSFGVDKKVRDVTVGRLNEPAERFRTADRWYIVTQRITATPGG